MKTFTLEYEHGEQKGLDIYTPLCTLSNNEEVSCITVDIPQNAVLTSFKIYGKMGCFYVPICEGTKHGGIITKEDFLSSVNAYKIKAYGIDERDFKYAFLIREQMAKLFSKNMTCIEYAYKTPKGKEKYVKYHIVPVICETNNNRVTCKRWVDTENEPLDTENNYTWSGLSLKVLVNELCYKSQGTKNAIYNMLLMIQDAWRVFKHENIFDSTTSEEARKIMIEAYISTLIAESYVNGQVKGRVDVEFTLA